jgi:hypothetical protein
MEVVVEAEMEEEAVFKQAIHSLLCMEPHVVMNQVKSCLLIMLWISTNRRIEEIKACTVRTTYLCAFL